MKTQLFLLLIVGIAYSCSQQPATEEATSKESSPVEREPSEMVILMHQMEAHILSLKDRQSRGDSISSSDLIDYSGMLTLSMTKGMNRDAAFEVNANDWMEKLKELTEASSSGQKDIYNGLIGSCVACHKNYCPGPIKRIEKLHL